MPDRSTADRDDAAASGAWRLRLLGTPALVSADGIRSLALRTKDAALLDVIARAGPIQSERVAALLWPSRARLRAARQGRAAGLFVADDRVRNVRRLQLGDVLGRQRQR
jgi:hypothetical protein